MLLNISVPRYRFAELQKINKFTEKSANTFAYIIKKPYLCAQCIRTSIIPTIFDIITKWINYFVLKKDIRKTTIKTKL